MLELDHIDPKWEEGRDYLLICGRNTSSNFCMRDRSLNSSKSNRFLPWRVSIDEVGCVPVEQGDLCLFLDPDTGEWVLEEFLGKWWFEKTKTLCAESVAGRTNFLNKTGVFNPEHLGKGAKTCYERKTGIHSPESKEKALAVKRERKVGFHSFEVQSAGGKCTRGKKWWVNKDGETVRSFTSPGEGWQNRRIWKG